MAFSLHIIAILLTPICQICSVHLYLCKIKKKVFKRQREEWNINQSKTKLRRSYVPKNKILGKWLMKKNGEKPFP